ncbi:MULTISPECIES: RNA polymerase sigma factor [unclassified Nonomuraea]|uniref:RNA polymerase sigma factor n=1 Tax=unclassified Nonomuraea TaxID=2593643 RepID=UPI0033DC4D56
MSRALPAQIGDAVIIEQSWGEPERFSAIFDRYYPEIHDYAARRLDSALADDIAAETFLIAFDKRTGYDLARPDARPWLYGITSNLIARHRRAEVRQYRALAKAGTEKPMEDHADRVAGVVDAGARKSRLAQALAEIADGDRDVLLLIAWAELTSEEAGSALGIPAGTARSRLHRARRKIQAVLGEDAS